jgi:hypothetical protein
MRCYILALDEGDSLEGARKRSLFSEAELIQKIDAAFNVLGRLAVGSV